MMKKVVLPLLVLSLSANAFAQFEKLKGKPAPKFTMKGTDGKTYTNALLRGKVVLIDMWATWCGPCKAASPSMESFHKKYAGKGLVVIGANTFEAPEAAVSKKAAIGYKKEHQYSYLFTYDNSKFAESLGVKGIPFFMLIDRKGIVRDVLVGFDESKTRAQLEAAIKKVL